MMNDPKQSITTGRPVVTTQPPPTASAQTGKPTGEKPLIAPPPLAPQRSVPFVIDSHREFGKYLKLLVYGDFGFGKTFLMGTSSDIPQMRDVLFINCEAGELTLDQDEGDMTHNFNLIDSIRVRDYGVLGRVQEFLKVHCRLREAQDMEGLRKLEARLRKCEPEQIETPRQYRTIILDTLTEAEAFCMYQLLGITDLTKIDEEVQSPEWADYRRQHMMVQRLIRAFRDLPMHFLVTCARNYVQNERKQFLYSPAMTGKLSSQVQGFMDMVGYLVAQPVSSAEGDDNNPGNKVMARRLYVQPVGQFAAKCRFSRFKGTYLDNPDIGKILKAIKMDKVLDAPVAARPTTT